MECVWEGRAQTFVPSAVPPKPWLLAFRVVRHAQVWASLSWNEGSGGGWPGLRAMPTSLGAPSIMHSHTQVRLLLLPPFKLPGALSHH